MYKEKREWHRVSWVEVGERVELLDGIDVNLTIMEEEFRPDGEEVTPTFKVKRRVIGERYGDMVNAVYKS